MIPRDLFARFDAAALRPPAPVARPEDWQAPPQSALALWAALRRWCFAGAGRHGAGQVADPSASRLPFSVAVLGEGDTAETSRLVESLCQDLDGSVQLAGCRDGASRLRLRLRVKLNDVLPGRTRLVTDPWDCGYAMDTAEAIDSLMRFSPRRATLIVAQAMAVDNVLSCIAALSGRQRTFRHPLRMLVIANAAADGPAPVNALPQRIARLGTPVTSIVPDIAAPA